MLLQRSLLMTIVLPALCLFACRGPQKASLHTLDMRRPADLREYFSYTGNDIPLISGHRGGAAIPGYPENCLATFAYVLGHTPAFFEVDPRLTKDSVIVLMHDATLDRTTTGTGKVSDHTWEELKKLRLKDPLGKVTGFRIPTLDQAIEWTRGKTILNLDKKDVPLGMISQKIKEHNAAAYVMVTVHNARQAAFYYTRNRNVMFSAFVKTREALESYEAAGIPWSHMIAYIGSVNRPESKVLYNLLHDRGVKCMISAAPVYDKLPDAAKRRTAYQEIVVHGADIIESDRPVEAAEAIQLLTAKELPGGLSPE